MFSRISAGTRHRNKECAAMVNDTLLSSRAFYMRLIPLMPNPCFRKDTGMVKQTHSTSYSEYKNMWTQLTQGFFTWGFRNIHVPHGADTIMTLGICVQISTI